MPGFFRVASLLDYSIKALVYREAQQEFRFASSTLPNFVLQGAAHEAAAGHALAEPPDNYIMCLSVVFAYR